MSALLKSCWRSSRPPLSATVPKRGKGTGTERRCMRAFTPEDQGPKTQKLRSALVAKLHFIGAGWGFQRLLSLWQNLLLAHKEWGIHKKVVNPFHATASVRTASVLPYRADSIIQPLYRTLLICKTVSTRLSKTITQNQASANSDDKYRRHHSNGRYNNDQPPRCPVAIPPHNESDQDWN